MNYATILAVMTLAASPASAAGPPFKLTGPEVAKLDWNTRALRTADLDGDGRLDLAVLNNDRARIELLYQRAPGSEREASKRQLARERWEPVLEDSRFEKVAVVAGQQMFDLAIGDLNGDGRADLAYTGRPESLTVRYQSEDGQFIEKRVFDLDTPVAWAGTIRAADIHGDGRTDLLVLTEKRLAVFSQNEQGQLQGPTLYPLSDANCAALRLIDVDGDGLEDLLYLSPQSPGKPLRARLALGGGRFGPEQAFDLQLPRSDLHPLRLGTEGTLAFAYLQRLTGLLEIIRPVKGLAGDEPLSVKALLPRTYSTRVDAKVPASYALGDFDGNGRLDVAVGDAESAEMLVYFQDDRARLGEPQKFPAVSDIRSIAAADTDGDGKAELIVVSPREKVLGISRYTDQGRMSYPQAISIEARPLSVVAAETDGDGKPELLLVGELDKKRTLTVLRRGDDGSWTAPPGVEIKDLRDDPSALRLVDANQDGRQDLAIFAPSRPMRLLLQGPQGQFTEAGGAASAAGALIDRLNPSELTTGDLDGDGKDELIIGGAAYARSARVKPDGRLEVIDQYNARQPDAAIAAAVPADLDGDGQRELLMIDSKSSTLQLLRRDDQGVYRFAESADIGKIDLVEVRVMDLDSDGHDDLMLLGKDRFWWVPLVAGELAFETVVTYETDLSDVTYTNLAVGDLNGDGRDDLLVADTAQTRVLEFLRIDDDGRPASAMHFAAYVVDPHYQGRGSTGSEPREIVTADVTGDGKDDLILLIHDRVLVYPQR